MARLVAIANQKGGVGKTTTAVNLAASLAIAERRTLLVDADPQGNATSGVGVPKNSVPLSLYDALVDGHPVHEIVIRDSTLPHLAVLPATQDLVGAELQLVDRAGRETMLRRVLEPLQAEYDYIIIDCPPSLGLLTLNVLAAANSVVIPIQCEYYGLEGISQLLNTVRLVQQNFNPTLAIDGVLLTMYDARLNLCRQVAEDAKEYFGAKVFRTPIPRNVRLAEAPSFGKPILMYDVQSVGAKSYLAVAQELMRRVESPGAEQPAAANDGKPAEPVAADAETAGAATVEPAESGAAATATEAPPGADTSSAAAPGAEAPDAEGAPSADVSSEESASAESASAEPALAESTGAASADDATAPEAPVASAAESASADTGSATVPAETGSTEPNTDVSASGSIRSDEPGPADAPRAESAEPHADAPANAEPVDDTRLDSKERAAPQPEVSEA